ncbi:hypothetical protein KIPB_009630, partial [Kipferlia bialata]
LVQVDSTLEVEGTITSMGTSGAALTISGGSGTGAVAGGDLNLMGGDSGTGTDGSVVLGGSTTTAVDIQSPITLTGTTTITGDSGLTIDAAGALTLGDADATSVAIGADDIEVTVSTSKFVVADVATVESSGLTLAGGLTFDGDADRAITMAQVSTTTTAGNNLTISAGAANTSGAGGNVSINGGAQAGSADHGRVVLGAANTEAVNVGVLGTAATLASFTADAKAVTFTGDATGAFSASTFATAVLDASTSVTIGTSSPTTTVTGDTASVVLASDTVTASTSDSSLTLATAMLTTNVGGTVSEISAALIDHKVATQVTTLAASGAVTLADTLSVDGKVTIASAVEFTAEATIAGEDDSAAGITIAGGSNSSGTAGSVTIRGGYNASAANYGSVNIGVTNTKTITIGQASDCNVAIDAPLVVADLQVATGLALSSDTATFPATGGTLTVVDAIAGNGGSITIEGGETSDDDGGDVIIRGGLTTGGGSDGTIILGETNTSKVVVHTVLEMGGTTPSMYPTESAVGGVDMIVRAGSGALGHGSGDGDLLLDGGTVNGGKVIVGSTSDGTLEISEGINGTAATLNLTSASGPSVISVSSDSTDVNLEISAKNEGSGSVTIHGNDASDGVVNIGTVTTKTVNVGSAATGVALTGSSVTLTNDASTVSVTSTNVEINTDIELTTTAGDTSMAFGVGSAPTTSTDGVDLRITAGPGGTVSATRSGHLYLDSGVKNAAVSAGDIYIGTLGSTSDIAIGSSSLVTFAVEASTSADVVANEIELATASTSPDTFVRLNNDAITLEAAGAIDIYSTGSNVKLGTSDTVNTFLVGKTVSITGASADDSIALGTDFAYQKVGGNKLVDLAPTTVQIGLDTDTVGDKTALTLEGTITAKFDDNNLVSVATGAVGITTVDATITSSGTTTIESATTVIKDTGSSQIGISGGIIALSSDTGVTVDVTTGDYIKIGTTAVEQLVTVGNAHADTTVTLTAGASGVAMDNDGTTITGTKTTVGSFSIAGNAMTGVTSATTTTSALYIAAGASSSNAVAGGHLYLNGGLKDVGGAHGNVIIGGVSTALIDLQTDVSIDGDISFPKDASAVISTSGDATGGDDLTLEAGSSLADGIISGHIILKPGYRATSSVENGQVQVHSDIEFDSSLDRTISVGSVGSGNGKSLTIAAGLSSVGAGGDVNILGGDGNVDTVGATNNGAVNVGTSDTSAVNISVAGTDVNVYGDIVFHDDLEFNGSKTIKASTGESLTVQGGDSAGDLILNGGIGNGLVNIGSATTSSILLGSSVTTTSGTAFTIDNDNIFTVNGNDLKLVGDN